CPVGFAFVHLRASASVNGESFDTHVLKALRDFFDVLGVVIPTESCLNGDWQSGRLYYSIGESYHQVDVFEYAGTGTFECDFFYWAAEIDVEEVRVCNIDDLCCE